MKCRETGLIFSTHLVQSIDAGEKTVTRRVIVPGSKLYPCPQGESGDMIYAKETFAFHYYYDAMPPRDVPDSATVWWKARENAPTARRGRWRSSRFMPKAIARIWLELLGWCIEFLQDIPVTDVAKEGIRCLGETTVTPLEAFAILWDELNGHKPGCSWAENPQVRRLHFRKVEYHPERSVRRC